MSNLINQAIIEPNSEKINFKKFSAKEQNSSEFSDEFNKNNLQGNEGDADFSLAEEISSLVAINDARPLELNDTISAAKDFPLLTSENFGDIKNEPFSSPSSEQEQSLLESTTQIDIEIQIGGTRFQNNSDSNTGTVNIASNITPGDENASTSTSLQQFIAAENQELSDSGEDIGINSDDTSLDNEKTNINNDRTSSSSQLVTKSHNETVNQNNAQSNNQGQHAPTSPSDSFSLPSLSLQSITPNSEGAIQATPIANNSFGITTPQTTAPQIASFSINSDNETVDIRLDPPELGKVQIKLEFRNGDLPLAVISAEKNDTLALLRNNEYLFQETLKEAGIENADLTYSEDSSQDKERTQHEQASSKEFAVIETTETPITPSLSKIPSHDNNYQLNLKL